MSSATESNGGMQATNDLNIFSRIVNVFFAPSKTFLAVVEKPKWALPLILSLVVILGAMYVLSSVVVIDSKAAMEEQMAERGMSDDQIAQAVANAENMVKISAMVAPILLGTIATFVLAGIWLMLGNTILGGAANYKQMLGVVVYSGFIGLLGFLIKMPIMLSQQTMNVHFSLATFMADASKDTFLYKALANVEIFNLWTIAVYSIGIAIVAKLKVKSVWPWVLILSILYWVAAAGLGSAFGQ